MFPWGHASVGYLLYSAYSRHVNGGVPPSLPALAVVLGTQFPDLVDKPLAWTFGVIPSGRMLGHSLFVLAIVCYLVYRVARAYGRAEMGIGFGIGVFSHVAMDSLASVLAGDWHELTFALWPVFPPRSSSEYGYSIIAYLLNIEPTPMVLLELAITVIGLGVWVRDGMPGIWTAFHGAQRLIGKHPE